MVKIHEKVEPLGPPGHVVFPVQLSAIEDVFLPQKYQKTDPTI